MDTKSVKHSHRSGSTNEGAFTKDSRLDIAEQMEALAIELRSMSDNEMQVVPTENTLLAYAQMLYAGRRHIDRVFDMPGFAVSPAWDIMLDLYHARAKGKSISVSSACIGASCPPTTGLRWLQALENMQLIEKSQDPDDKRRTTVKLTEKGWLHTAKVLKFHLRS